MLKRLKRLNSHSAHARFLAECAEDELGWIPMQKDIPSPYAYSPEWAVYDWQGTPIILRETAHKQYDVFEVPKEMIRNGDPLLMEQESNYNHMIGDSLKRY